MPARKQFEFASEKLGSCLILEDDSIILIDIEYTMQQLGVLKLYTATSIAGALKILETQTPAFALLDFEVGRTNSLQVAADLRKRQIPFLFLTAYGDAIELPKEFMDTPVVAKPFDTSLLFHTIYAALGLGASDSITRKVQL